MERVYINSDPNKNLPTHEYIILKQRYKEVKALTSSICFNNKANHNLTPSQKEVIVWHFRLVHIGFQHVPWLIFTGRLKVRVNSKAFSNCGGPKCDACEFVKVHIRYNKVNTINNNPMKEKELKKDNLMPG